MSSVSSASFAQITAESLIIGLSRPMVEVRYLLRQVAPSSASVIAHRTFGQRQGSGRPRHPRGERPRRASRSSRSIAAAIPRDLLESELFGHEKGAFTGAIASKRGQFEEADGGTLFLDEIGDMPAEMQVKLLRVLQERAVQRVGGRGQIAVDVRIIAATHRDLDEAIDAGSVPRGSLLPPQRLPDRRFPRSRERREDIPLLVHHFLARPPGRAATRRSSSAARSTG